MPTLEDLIAADLAARTGAMQARKLALLAAARAAFPTIPINDALLQHLRP